MTGFLRSLALVCSLIWPLTVWGGSAAGLNLPDLGDGSASVVSPAQERKLGEDFMRRARQQLSFVDDPEITQYIQSLGQRLVAASDDTAGRDFRFFVIRNPTINAFAVPGGFIGVHTGLIQAVESEAELASVLAHEIAHVTQRHLPRLIAESQRTTLPAMAAILASILLASSGHQGAEAGIAAATAAVAQHEINFTRSFEEEADRLGMGILAAAGFDPRAMPDFFERMQSLNRHNETNLPEFLRTHPVTTYRIADSRNRAERLPYRARDSTEEFHHVQAKLRALAPGDPAEIARGFKENLAQHKHRSREAERYGYAIALKRSRALEAARAEARSLLAEHPARVAYRLLLAEIELEAGRTEQGLAQYAAALKQAPDSLPAQYGYAQALLRGGRARDALGLLRQAVRQRQDEPMLYKLLAQAAVEAGSPFEAHQALAEYYYLNGNLHAALDQLRIAARHAGDSFYRQSSVEARIQSINEEIALFREK